MTKLKDEAEDEIEAIQVKSVQERSLQQLSIGRETLNKSLE